MDLDMSKIFLVLYRKDNFYIALDCRCGIYWADVVNQSLRLAVSWCSGNHCQWMRFAKGDITHLTSRMARGLSRGRVTSCPGHCRALGTYVRHVDSLGNACFNTEYTLADLQDLLILILKKNLQSNISEVTMLGFLFLNYAFMPGGSV